MCPATFLNSFSENIKNILRDADYGASVIGKLFASVPMMEWHWSRRQDCVLILLSGFDRDKPDDSKQSIKRVQTSA
jgi:hypothetical protein